MTMQMLTLALPEPLYSRLKARADQTQRTVEDEVLDVLATAVPIADDLPDDLEQAISSLTVLDDVALWRAARSHFSTQSAQQLEELHIKRQREELTDAESQTVERLVRQYERSMLVRAQAAALLKQRGHDVSGLLVTA